MGELIGSTQQTLEQHSIDLESMVYGDPSEQLVDAAADVISTANLRRISEIVATTEGINYDSLVVSRLVHRSFADFKVPTSSYRQLLPRLARTSVLTLNYLNGMPAESDGTADVAIANFSLDNDFSFKSLRRHLHPNGLAVINLAASNLSQSEARLSSLGFRVVRSSQDAYAGVPWQQFIMGKQQ